MSETLFVQSSWLLTSLTLVVLVLTFLKHREILVKPSFWSAASIFLTLQVSSSIHAVAIYRQLESPWNYWLVFQVFPLLLSVGTGRFLLAPALDVWQQLCPRFTSENSKYADKLSGTLLVTAFLILVWYLSEVPFKSTGLYSLFADQENAKQARENSLKLLSNPLLKYAYTFLCTVVAPMAAILAAQRAKYSWKNGRPKDSLYALFAIFGLVFCVSLPGARYPGALIFLAISFSFLFESRAKIRVRYALGGGILIFLVPAIISTLGDPEPLSLDSVTRGFMNVLDRAFGRGIEDGIWHVKYIDRFGYFGLAGIGNLSRIWGDTPSNIFNAVGVQYYPNRLTSISANTSLAMAYFSCIGPASLFVSVGLVLLLDLVLFLYLSLDRPFFLPCVATCSVAALGANATFFTTLLITHGFLLAPIFCLLLQSAYKLTRPQTAKIQPVANP